jgi:NADH pyrophosphatase NudC (nudix superfamily)
LTGTAPPDKINADISLRYRSTVRDPAGTGMPGAQMATIPKTKNKPQGKDGRSALARARERLDQKRVMRDRSTHWAHYWNICPKCGGDMFEQKTEQARFEVCRKCHGIYLDQAELDLSMKYLDHEEFLELLAKKAKKPDTD